MSSVHQHDFAPVAVFAYRRTDHLSRCLASLAANAEARHTHLHVFCDGPRSGDDRAAVEAVRGVVAQLSGFATVTPVLRETNLGLAQSIIRGVGQLLEFHERVIVVEDDLLLSRHFLRYMNDALARYESAERVASIHGYCYPVRQEMPETFFLRGADCWGWATWRRAWQHFNSDGRWLLSELQARGLTKAFDLDGAYPFSRMLADQVRGLNESWAVRWHASCFLNDMLTLYPGRSLVHNIGNDASGTHSRTTSRRYDGDVSSASIDVRGIPIEPSRRAREAFIRFLRPSPWVRMARGVATIMRDAGWRVR